MFGADKFAFAGGMLTSLFSSSSALVIAFYQICFDFCYYYSFIIFICNVQAAGSRQQAAGEGESESFGQVSLVACVGGLEPRGLASTITALN